MAEYIEKEAVLNRIKALVRRITPIEENRDMFYHDSGINGAITGALLEVKKAPAADVVEVVRCGQCRFLCPEVDAYTQEVVGYWCCLLDLGSVEENHFCSYGERRGGCGMNRAEFTVYLRADGLPVCFGTARECAAALGLSPDAFYGYARRSRLGECPTGKYIVVKEEAI